ncbi:MAG TPA: nucleotide exchange factor GrpE [Blastocatellia bacterium]|nr:nucleotide exchange factor GrpE [Blastocatellia bacterium]
MRDKKNEPRDIPINFEGEENLESSLKEGSDLPQETVFAADAEQPVDEPAGVEIEASDPEGVDESLPEDSTAKLQSQIDGLLAEKSALYDKLLRGQAEFENYRKRTERERAELYQHGRDDVLLQFLPVVDNFERALSSLETSEGDAEALRHGVELIHKQFKDALSKFGLEAVEAVGQTFDPHVHEAVTTEATDKHKENTVIQEFQRGYRIGDRLLRPAKVKVASSPEK